MYVQFGVVIFNFNFSGYYFSFFWEITDLVKSNELAHPQHLGVVSCRSRIKPLDYRRDVSEYTGVHQGCFYFFENEWKRKDKHFSELRMFDVHI